MVQPPAPRGINHVFPFLRGLAQSGYSGRFVIGLLRAVPGVHFSDADFYNVYTPMRETLQNRPDLMQLPSDAPVPRDSHTIHTVNTAGRLLGLQKFYYYEATFAGRDVRTNLPLVRTSGVASDRPLTPSYIQAIAQYGLENERLGFGEYFDVQESWLSAAERQEDAP